MALGSTTQLNIVSAYDVVVTGTLPSGDTKESVTYFIIDTTNKSVVGQVVLPDAVRQPTEVSVIVKVSKPSGTYAIGIFEKDGSFRASSFLSARTAH